MNGVERRVLGWNYKCGCHQPGRCLRLWEGVRSPRKEKIKEGPPPATSLPKPGNARGLLGSSPWRGEDGAPPLHAGKCGRGRGWPTAQGATRGFWCQQRRPWPLTWSHRSPPASLSSDYDAQLRCPERRPQRPAALMASAAHAVWHRCGHHRPRWLSSSVPPTVRVPERTQPGAGHEGEYSL